MKPTTQMFLAQAERLVGEVKPMFAGQHPAVIGTALAELVAMHFAGTRPDLRDKARADFIAAVDDLVPECQKMIFPDGLPPEWR